MRAIAKVKSRFESFTFPTFKRPSWTVMPWTKHVDFLQKQIRELAGNVEALENRVEELEDSMGSCAANMDDLESQVNDNCISSDMVEGMIEDAIEEIDFCDHVNMALRHASFEVSLCV